MHLKDRLLLFWNDPVWSKVIAAGLTAIFGLLFLWLYNQFISTTALPNWLIIVLPIVVLCAASYLIREFRRPKSRMLVYVSSGGTCRDPMAKVITTKLLENRKLNHPLQIKAAALGPLSKSQASYAARYVIKEMYNEDLLAQHKPELLTLETVEQADLILVMDETLLTTPGKTLPKGKTFLLKEFFGLKGDIEDPFPDGKDEATLSRYRECAKEIQDVIGNNIDRLINVLDV